MNRCIKCFKEIKKDHAFCLDCYNKLDKSEAIKMVLSKYKKEEVKHFDNYNNSLKYFSDCYSFLDYTNKTFYNNYVVRKKNINETISDDIIDCFNAFNLKNEFASLSYLDSLYFLRCVFSKINDSNILANCKIYMEYSINNLKEQRIDYILAYKNKLICLEFGQSDTLTMKELAKKKEAQLDEYIKQLKIEIPKLKLKQVIKQVFVYSSNEATFTKQINHLISIIKKNFTNYLNYELLNEKVEVN